MPGDATMVFDMEMLSIERSEVPETTIVERTVEVKVTSLIVLFYFHTATMHVPHENGRYTNKITTKLCRNIFLCFYFFHGA